MGNSGIAPIVGANHDLPHNFRAIRESPLPNKTFWARQCRATTKSWAMASPAPTNKPLGTACCAPTPYISLFLEIFIFLYILL